MLPQTRRRNHNKLESNTCPKFMSFAGFERSRICWVLLSGSRMMGLQQGHGNK
jgi:hypothetical protein